MNELSTAEIYDLQQCEVIIERGLATFVEVGTALLKIRDNPKWYRENYGTFEFYCQKRWQMTDRRARQLCAAAEIAGNLGTGTMVPNSERVARPLTRPDLKPDQQREAWSHATEEYGQPTAAQVKATVDEMFPRREPLDGQGTLFDDAPKPKDPDHDSIGESWIKIVNDCGIALTSIDRRGGVAKLIHDWPIQRQWGFVSATERMRDRCQELVNQAKEVIQCQGNGSDKI